jgi:hypothetical protein
MSEVFLTAYLTALRLRKTGELTPKKSKAKPARKPAAKRARKAKPLASASPAPALPSTAAA